jgi:two-component system response regulator ArlR
MKLLVVEDEIEMQEIIRQSLEKENFLIESALTFQAALDKIISFEYDCILLDVMLPGGSGLSLLQELKILGKSDNVIIISAKDSIDDKILGLNLGADDYLVKPFHIAELTARIKSVLRRKSLDGKNNLVFGNLNLDFQERIVKICNLEIVLNRKEFDILYYLLINKNRLVNKTALAEQVWGDYIDEISDFEFLYSQIKNLRKKLKESNSGVEIQAIYGVGYKLVLA